MTHRPRKRFGQNFLHDPAVIARIVDAVDPAADDHVVEIGPGHGALTSLLLARAGRLDAVEIDRDLAAALALRFRESPGFSLHVADALQFDFGALATGGKRLRIVGNLPYNISTPLIFHLLDQIDRIADLTVMLQKEVVDRMAALPGNKVYGRLTVMLAAHCRVDRLFDVGAGAFKPAPKVVSAVARLTPHAVQPFPLPGGNAFGRLVARAFSMRRKTLRRSLSGWLDEADFAAADVEPSLRPEAIDPAAFGRLAARLALRERRGEPAP